MDPATERRGLAFPGVEAIAVPWSRSDTGDEPTRVRFTRWINRIAVGTLAGLGLFAILLGAVWAADDLGGRDWTTAEAANAYVARRIVADELLVRGDPAAAAEVIAAEAAIRTPEGVRSGPSGFVTFVDRLYAAAPDAIWEVRAISPAGDRVRLDTRLTGTFRLPFLGQSPATDAVALPVTIDVLIVSGRVRAAEFVVGRAPGEVA